MKKLFFAFVVGTGMILASCNNKPAEETTVTADTTTVIETVVETVTPADTTTVITSDTITTK